MIARLVLVLAAAFVSALPLAAADARKPLKVFILAGQSNMDNPLFPASGPAPGSLNGLHPKSKF